MCHFFFKLVFQLEISTSRPPLAWTTLKMGGQTQMVSLMMFIMKLRKTNKQTKSKTVSLYFSSV